MKNFFKPEDFLYPTTQYIPEILARMANEKLNELIESCPVVYFNDDKTMTVYWEASSRQDKLHTHKARLAFIEEIKKEPCKHESEVYRNTWNDTGARYIIDAENTKCKHCGVELQASWSEK